jgi:hypothetical protein
MAGVFGMWLFGMAAAFYEMPVRVVPQASQAQAVPMPVGLVSNMRPVTPPLAQGSAASGLAWAAPVAMLAVAAAATSARKVRPGPRRVPTVTMFSEGDIGVLPPLGVYDPLGLIGSRDMRRYEVMEIKHGRAAMLAFLNVITLQSGARFPGYISPSNDLQFSDIPAGCFASLEALPTASWLQIMTVTCFMDTGYFLFSADDPTKAPGDISGGLPWVRYDDPEVRTFKLNAERQNGRAAMLGITGCLIHELLGVNALFPIVQD